MKDENAVKFYGSKAWKRCRAAYKKKAGGLCERCLANGVIRPGEVVHHKIYISPDTMNDPAVSMNFDNLELVCRDCHEKEHGRMKKRYKFDEFGRVLTEE